MPSNDEGMATSSSGNVCEALEGDERRSRLGKWTQCPGCWTGLTRGGCCLNLCSPGCSSQGYDPWRRGDSAAQPLESGAGAAEPAGQPLWPAGTAGAAYASFPETPQGEQSLNGSQAGAWAMDRRLSGHFISLWRCRASEVSMPVLRLGCVATPEEPESLILVLEAP